MCNGTGTKSESPNHRPMNFKFGTACHFGYENGFTIGPSLARKGPLLYMNDKDAEHL